MSRNDHAPMSGPACERHAERARGPGRRRPRPARPRQPLDEHLADCAACRDLLADLREIRSLAATLEPIEPPARVWRAVRRRTAAAERNERPRRSIEWRHGWSLGGAALAGAAAVAATVLVIVPTDFTLPPRSKGPAGPAREAVAAALEQIERPHADAIRELEQSIGTGAPIPVGAREALTRNLAVVDDAIAESRSAVAADPGAAVPRERLQAGLAHKLTLLRTMAALELEGG